MPRAKRGQADYLGLRRRLRSDMTGPEKRLWTRLRARQVNGLKFRRQHGIGPYIVDFYCPERSLVVEVDGDSHADTKQLNKDRERDDYLRSIGLRVVRYSNSDITNNLDGVLEDLQTRVRSTSTSPLPVLSDSTSPNPSLRRRGKED